VARKGDTIENPRRRERALFLETGADTGGRRAVVRVTAEPSTVGTPLHRHPAQTETFIVRSGTVTYLLGDSREQLSAGAGETVVVEPGVAHSWWNAGPATLEVDATLEPAGRFQFFIETVYGLIRDGKVTRGGMPNILQMAVIAHEYRDDWVLARIPRAAQVLVLPVVAAFGRLLGYRATYPRYSGVPERDHGTPKG
jgi:quercetin dioxygenase-like cupin family protein